MRGEPRKGSLQKDPVINNSSDQGLKTVKKSLFYSTISLWWTFYYTVSSSVKPPKISHKVQMCRCFIPKKNLSLFAYSCGAATRKTRAREYHLDHPLPSGIAQPLTACSLAAWHSGCSGGHWVLAPKALPSLAQALKPPSTAVPAS